MIRLLPALLFGACVRPEGESGVTVTAMDDTGTGVPTGDALVADTVPVVISSTACSACGGDCRLDELYYENRYHTTEPIAYADQPPAGGPHNPCWTEWGVHDTPVEDDNWVHNLEHGGVVFLHDCTDCDAEVDAIAALTTGYGMFTVVTPYTMETSYAQVACGWRRRVLPGPRGSRAGVHHGGPRRGLHVIRGPGRRAR
jgi:hypothetical protein